MIDAVLYLLFFFSTGTSALSGIREEVKQIAVGPSHFALLLEDGRLARLPFSVISDRYRRDLLYQAVVGSSVPDLHQERPSVKKDADPDCS